MKDRQKTKEQLVSELVEMRQRITELEKVKVERKQAEEKLWEAQERFSGIFNSSMDAIGFLSLERVWLEVNDAFCQLTGYSREELLSGKTYQEITLAEYHEWEARIIERVVRTGKPAEYEKEYIRKDGCRVPILLTTFIVRGADGKPALYAPLAPGSAVRPSTSARTLPQTPVS